MQINEVAIAMSDANKESSKTTLFVFPSWHNRIPALVALVIGPLATVFAIFAVWYWFSPKLTDAGYMPEQPVAYSHKLHAGELKIDCRYCHVAVEKTAWAGVPPTATCMNCHTNIKTRVRLALVRSLCLRQGDSLGSHPQDCGLCVLQPQVRSSRCGL